MSANDDWRGDRTERLCATMELAVATLSAAKDDLALADARQALAALSAHTRALRADLARVTEERDAATAEQNALSASLADVGRLQRSRRDWIDAGTSVLPRTWSGGPDNLRRDLATTLAEAEERGYDRGRNDQLEADEARTRETRAAALTEAAEALRADTAVLFDTRDGADWLRNRAARERGER